MMKTKILIAITAFVALGVLATGVVLAHNPYAPTTTYHDERYAPDTGYYYGGCYRYDSYYRYRATPEPNTPEQPTSPSTPEQPTHPGYYYPPQTPNEDYYARNYGRGCWGW